jgi:hypothetical protein
MPPLLPLRHGMRIGSLQGADTSKWPDATGEAVTSDTGELVWAAGQVTTNTARTASITGRWTRAEFPWGRLETASQFSAAMVHSLDGKPISDSSRLLVTFGGRTANSGMRWNDKRTTTLEAGSGPVLMECGSVSLLLRRRSATSVEAQALDGGGVAIGTPVRGERSGGEWKLTLRDATTWYVVTVR